MAGRREFATDEWGMLQRAMMAAGVLVSLADGTVDPEEVHALSMELRSARFAHRSQLVHELADVPGLDTNARPQETTYADYRDPALDAIRKSIDILKRKAPDELPSFQEFLVNLAEVVADANRKGDMLGVGAVRRTPEELEALQAIRTALGV